MSPSPPLSTLLTLPHPQCSAIDYTLHTLHGAASLLNSNKYFPSRITIKETSIPRLSSVARRIYRIFSHAYFHHRALYDQFEVSWPLSAACQF